MSEEILKALTQLFAIITKQGEGVTDVERQFVEQFFKQRLSKDSVQEYLDLYDSFLVDKPKKKKRREREGKENIDSEKKERKSKLTSMKDSVRTLSICKKINKTLAQKQKVIVLIELLELVNSDKNFSPQRREIINTVAEVFKVSKEEYKIIEKYVLATTIDELDYPSILIASSQEFENKKHYNIVSEHLGSPIVFLKIESVDLYFVQALGQDETILNSQVLRNESVYLYSAGSILKPAKGAPFYYSDVISNFNNDSEQNSISFNCKEVEFHFPNGAIGLRGIDISESRGKLLGIMGASGAGKTTLLNVLAGLETPSKGEVLINGINIHKEKKKIQGVIGYITQDDILIEDLTVFENLYYNAKLCFKDKNESEIIEIVEDVLKSLSLLHIKDLKVGNVLNKKISGGQRKRLNIALELIREPAVMFVDEPTSGLSSRDSENVIDLLKELSLKGKLIFVVIHQPSSEIYKMFDKMFIMDTGGYPIFYGDPIDAIIHFKKATNQINSDRGQCSECGNVNPEQLFDIVEARVVNEYGQESDKRKVTPQQWGDLYKNEFTVVHVPDEQEDPPNSLKIPTKIIQWLIFTGRDLRSKLSNTQYLLINLLEAPILALLLSFLIRYTNSPDGTEYMFRYNENLPAYILMSIVIALFMGLTVSAEEIIKDRKILKREKLLNLSKTSYLFSKVGILFMLSALQTLMFVVISHLVLEIHNMMFSYWLILFSVSCFANILGLNISSSFNSAITVYIIIPLLLIPQMMLSGALFNFDKLNGLLSSKDKAPIVADIMASRWAYEAVAVKQYRDNSYQEHLFELEKKSSQLNFKQTFLIPELENILNECQIEKDATKQKELFTYVKNEVVYLQQQYPNVELSRKDDIALGIYSASIHTSLKSYFSTLDKVLNEQFTTISNNKDQRTVVLNKLFKKNHNIQLNTVKNDNYNESLEEIVKNLTTKHRIIRYNGKLVQKIDPIFQEIPITNIFNYRTPFFTASKPFFGKYVDTFVFNLLVIWFMSIFLYFTLYFDLFKKLIDFFGHLKLF